MALSEFQKNRIESNIKSLDYLDGMGVLTSDKVKLTDEMFVFIGVGGAGTAALASVKKAIRCQVDSDCITKQTMFLAIDSAHAELDKMVEDDVFDANEVLKLPYVLEKNPNSAAKAWVNRGLWAMTNAGTGAESGAFNGTCAGAIRQCGRVLFTQSVTQHDLVGALFEIKNKLAKNSAQKIQVIFFAGLAGGTGSGTIVDLAFLSRHYLKQILGAAYSGVTFSAYLLLPSACGTELKIGSEAMTGNQNAYAALKEIDYYMNITKRNEHFTMDYGTTDANSVDVEENIFDFCNLVEGIGEDGKFFINNAETARQIVADSILNTICLNRSGANDFMVDSFFSNHSAKVPGFVANKPDSQWPKDCNYSYSVIGYSACVIPIDLLTVCLAKKVFDEVFKRFRKADDATEDRAALFLEACGLDVKHLEKVWKTIQKEQLKKDIQAQADAEFKANGPYYVVNLLKEAINLIENSPNEYTHFARNKQSSYFANKDKWAKIERIYGTAGEFLSSINTTLYDVYTYVIEVLRDMINKNAGLLTDTNEYKNTFGKTFCWSPIDLTPGDQASKAVIEYLDGILPEKDVKRLAEKFVDMLCEHKDEWTGLNVEGNMGIKFNVDKEIREFISSNFDKCITTTMEDYIVKAYSGKNDAPVSTFNDHGQEVPSEDMETAAGIILGKLTSDAKALASVVNSFRLEDCYSNIYLTVPDNCKFLYQAMEDKNTKFTIYESSAHDRIVLSKLYDGVPAWALFWTKKAEEDYEAAPPTLCGLHIDQGEGGRDWSEMPNLYPEKLWSGNDGVKRTREAAISKRIRDLITKAKNVDMVVPDEKEPDYYDMYLINGTYTAKELLDIAELNGNDKYTMSQVLNILVDKGIVKKEKIDFIDQVMKPYETISDPMKLTEYRYNMACRTLRRLNGKWKQFETGLDTFEKLKTILPEPVNTDTLNLFVKALAYDLLSYDGRRGYWSISARDEKRIGEKIEDKLQKVCAHYYGYQRFLALDEDTMEELNDKIKELDEKTDEDDELLDRFDSNKKLLKASLRKLRDAQKPVSVWPEDSQFAADANESEWPMASVKFEQRAGEATDAIRKFYDDLIANI